MQPEELVRHLAALGEAIASALRSDPAVREAARRLGSWLLDVADHEHSSEIDAPSTPAAQSSVVMPAMSVSAPPLPAPPVRPVELNIGGQRQVVQVPGTLEEALSAERASSHRDVAPVAPAPRPAHVDAVPPPDLPLLMKRARLKSEACRWAITRRRRLAEGAAFDTTIKPYDVDLAVRAISRDCFLWTLDPFAVLPDDESLQRIAACYDNLVAGAELALELSNETTDDNHGYRHDAYQLLAEAQSSVRQSLFETGRERDQDQQEAFTWLKQRTVSEQIYLERHMRLDDPADPSNWMDLANRITALREEYQGLRDRERERRQWLNKAAYHASRIANTPAGEAGHDWATLVHALESLLEAGVPPSDTAIRELLMPILDLMPDDVTWPVASARIMEEIDRYVASREALRLEAPPARAPSRAVQEVANLLRGRVIVLIGGQRRQQSLEALQRAFELDEVRWLSSSPHESLFTFEPSIARPETALALLAIRWSSHSFEGVKSLCDRYGKPFVRLPAGYNPNQVAMQILAQVGDTLAIGARAASPRPA